MTSDWDEMTTCYQCSFVIRRDDAITAAEGWHEGEEFCPDCYDDYLWGWEKDYAEQG